MRVLELALREVRKRQRFVASFSVRTPGPDFSVSVDRFERGGEVEVFLAKEAKPGKPDECGNVATVQVGRPCSGMVGEADAAANLLRLTVPRVCLKRPEWVRVGARSQAITKPYPSDTWGRRTDIPKNNPLVNPLGPRVHAAAP
ncbi:hypothetical protein [Nocardioides sp.]|uniref:hypothetical protein n=1 Tax=Nocardioides sp. TaxID=35761 RepID=UPI001A226DD6|nr:hypothetical protein [Nocardioides sp.]MBJ7355843.1 hypothetical protein [Nocardioides sp.]